MKKLLQSAAALLLFSSVNFYFATAFAQGTAFTYQGQLNNGGSPVNGSYDLTFNLFATNTAGVAIALPVTNNATGVSNGLFTVTINFGATAFTGGSNWLEIAVRTNATGNFTTLAPRQQLTPTPYAIFSANAGNATTATTATTAVNVTGNITDPQLSANIGRLNGTNTFTGTNTFQGVTMATNGNNVIFGAFTGNGGGLTNLNAAQLNGSAVLSNLTLNGTLNLPNINGSTPDIINSGGTQILYADAFENFFIGHEFVNVAPTSSDNTGIGGSALASITSGTENTAVGSDALQGNSTGNNNTAVGGAALNSNSTGSDSTAVGSTALSFAIGAENTAIGSQALRGSPSGHIRGTNNIALGYKAGFAYGANESSNIDIGNLGVAGDQNMIRIGTPGVQTNAFIAGTLYGDGGGLTNLNAAQLTSVATAGNFFVGATAGNSTTSGQNNMASGRNALSQNTTGFDNTAIGVDVLATNTTGSGNTALGFQALFFNTTGSDNTAIGQNALFHNTNSSGNTAVGISALQFNRSGSQNTAVGLGALDFNTSSNNIALGWEAGFNITTGSSNIDIGNLGVTGDTNIIRIGDEQSQTFIAGVINGNGGGLTNLSAAQLNGSVPSGVSVPAANLTGALPAISGASLTGLNASQLTTGTVPSARVSGTYSSAVTLNNTGNSFIGSMQVGGNGTAFTLVQAGQAQMPPASTTETNFLITYPQPFSSAPKVICSIAFGIQGAPDVYTINVSSNSTTAFRVNVMRLDATGGWGQVLLINWQAWL